jgi:hypothetical protein
LCAVDEIGGYVCGGVVLGCLFHWRLRASFNEADPPGWRIKGTMAVVEWGIDVIKEVPDCIVLAFNASQARGKLTVSHNDTTKLVLRHCRMHD